MDETCDIAVVGAGPAGSTAARAAASKGLKVLLIDQRPRIGLPVRCGEFAPQWVSRLAPFSSACTLQAIETLVTHLPDGTSSEMASPGYMLDRSRFDKELAVASALAGAEILTGAKAVGCSPEGLTIGRGADRRTVRPAVIIGADGVHSSVARWLGRPPPKTIVALQYEVVLAGPQSRVEVFFHKDYEGGYAWFFPKGKTANVGVGVLPSKAPRLPHLLQDLIGDLERSRRLFARGIVAQTGGHIPCEAPRKSVFGNTILAGDAACHCHPITGAGILNAMIAGEAAGRVAAEAVIRGDIGHLASYEEEWRESFGKSLDYAAGRRRILEEEWGRPAIGFEDLIRRTWVGFREYYKDRMEDREASARTSSGRRDRSWNGE